MRVWPNIVRKLSCIVKTDRHVAAPVFKSLEALEGNSSFFFFAVLEPLPILCTVLTPEQSLFYFALSIFGGTTRDNRNANGFAAAWKLV